MYTTLVSRTLLLPALLLLVLSLTGSCDAVRIIEHASRLQQQQIALTHSSPEDFTRSSWILFVDKIRLDGERATISALTGERHDWDEGATLDALNATLERDHCHLMRVSLGDTHLMFKVYCDTVVNQPDDARVASRVLNYTLRDFFYKIFPRSSVHIENNKLIRRPHFYGSEDLLRYAIRRDGMARHRQGGGGGDQPALARDPLRYPRDSTYGRIRENNFFQTNGVQWALARIDMHTGVLEYQYEYVDTASDVDAYVIDTGIRPTSDEFPGGRAEFLINTVGDGQDTDGAGHGTFVASEIGGITYGVAKSVHLYGIKVLNDLGDGDLFTIQAGVMQAIETANARKPRRAVVNLSLGGSKSALLDATVASLTAAGIVTVVSAGNTGQDACLFSPAGLGGVPSAQVLTVGATDINDDKPNWSNLGACVSLSAPGVNISGAWFTSDQAVNVLSGTSMSAPLVTGVAAIILQQNRNLTVAQVKALILAWVTPGVVQFASQSGGGRNLLYSLIDVGNTSVFPTPAPTSAPGPPPPGGGGGGGGGGFTSDASSHRSAGRILNSLIVIVVVVLDALIFL